MSDAQLSLFQGPNQQPGPIEDDIAAKAARIGANARYTGDTRRPSDATIDQGWKSEALDAEISPSIGAVATAGAAEQLEPSEPYVLTTVNIKGHTYIQAVSPSGEVLAKREAGEGGSKELYDLVARAADNKLAGSI